MNQPNAGQYADFAIEVYNANVKALNTIAEKCIKENSMPPIMAVMPGMAEFLAQLQKLSFMAGAASAAYAILTDEDGDIEVPESTELTVQ